MNNPIIQPGTICEVRILGHAKGVHVGYFDNEESLYAAVKPFDGKAKGIYSTLNPVMPDLFARAPNRIISSDTATTDPEIVRRAWLLLDYDPIRNPKSISSTEAEKAAAFKKANTLKMWLTEQGWPEPVEADSGNGAHLLYRIDLPNDKPSHAIIEGVLKALASKFDDAAVKLDTVVHNAARITKLYNTLACKGPNTSDRPHRRSRILSTPADIKVVPTDLLIALVKMKTTEKTKTTGMNLEAVIARYKFTVVRTKPWDGSGVIYELEACPFNPDHERKATLMQFADGGVAFKCVKESCADHDWAALRGRFAEMAMAQLSTLPVEEVKVRWLSFVDDLDAVGVHALIADVARRTGIGINTLKQALAEHRTEAAKAAKAERIGTRTVIPLYAGDVCRAATQMEAVMLPQLTDGECIRFGDCVMSVCVESLPHAHQADSELPALPTAQLKVMTRAKLLPLVERSVIVRNEAGTLIDAPERVLDQILVNPQAIPQVSALITHPVVTRNGRIISASGIDADTRLLMYGPVIEGLRPYTQDEGCEGMKEIEALFLEGFEFATLLDRAVALSMLFTAVERKLLDQSPGVLADAAQQGSGKTTLARRTHIVVTGTDLPVFTWPDDDVEVQKLLFAALLSSPAMVCFDNVGDGMRFHSPALAAAMTSATKKDRVLGFSRDAIVSTATFFVLTGNNVELGNDEASRILPTRLITKDANPHKRSFAHPDVMHHGLDIRETVLRHLVGIVAGYRQGAERIVPLSRFPMWDAMVRQPLLWAGVADVGAMFDHNIEHSTELGAHLALVIHLKRIFLDDEFSAGRLIKFLNEDVGAGEEPHPVVQALWGLRVKDIRSERSVGHALSRMSDRTVEIDGVVYALRKRTLDGLTRYRVGKGILEVEKTP